MPHTIHSPFVVAGPKQKPVSALEAVGMSDPDPFTRALFAATLKQTSEEMKAFNSKHHLNIGNMNEMKKKVMSMSLYPNIYMK